MWENDGCASGDGVAASGEVRAWKVDGAGDNKADEGRDGNHGKKEKARECGPAASNMTSLVAAALGASGDFAAGLLHSRGLGVALPCASAKRSRLLHPLISDFRPPSVTESGEAALRRLVASRGTPHRLGASLNCSLKDLCLLPESGRLPKKKK